ncbi:type III secretion system inner membrane ring lipoprotein SctJ [Burkholderia ambifaria]|uniref:type III secretion system inner membrane ring lipoprotein SctJ n=1 Tax=Burkholderia ambifaria TaxID=152480 RepID=UPI0024461B11|nr:type III secretion inner membrane ring lipoprotein SctJ [Burkholderia ambifaria]
MNADVARVRAPDKRHRLRPREGRKGPRWRSCLAGALCVFALSACEVDLLTGITQRQANEVIAQLERHNIDATKREQGKGTFAIQVHEQSFADAVSLLEALELPSQEDLRIADLFPADSLVSTPGAQRVRLISGMEQRLEQTVRSIDHVLSARVHASYPMADDERNPPPMHLSMMVNYDGPVDDAMLVEKLRQIAKNSFESLNYENISVVVFHTERARAVLRPAVDLSTGARVAGRTTLLAGAGLLLVTLAVAAAVMLRRRYTLRSASPDTLAGTSAGCSPGASSASSPDPNGSAR